MKNQTLIKMLALGVAGLLTLTGAQAATITWTGQGVITNNTFLALAGTTANEVYGIDFGAGSLTTANGYSFADGIINGNFSIAGTPSTFNGYLAGQSSGDTNLNTILANGDYGNDTTNTGTLKNLVIGQTYTVLAFIDDNRAGTAGGTLFEINDGTANSPQQTYASLSAPASPLGGFLVGTFTADAITQAFTIDNNNSLNQFGVNVQYNGILLETASVPEPSTIALGLSGALVLGLWLFRRRLA